MMTRKLFSALLILTMVSSCAIMEIDSEQIANVDMQLEHDTVYVMVGDTFLVRPVFKPDSVTISDVFFQSDADTVVSVHNDSLLALSEGWTTLRAISVQYVKEDSCHVCVMPRWEWNPSAFPYDMVVYAQVTVHGKPFDPATMQLGAFVHNKLRGVGELREWKGQKYVCFRIGSDIPVYDDDEDFAEKVEFRVYHRKELRYEVFPKTLLFDGETHGTLSALYQLSL